MSACGVVLDVKEHIVRVLSGGTIYDIPRSNEIREINRSNWVLFDKDSQNNTSNVRRTQDRLATRIDQTGRLLARVHAAVCKGNENALNYSAPWSYEFGELRDPHRLMTAEKKILPDLMYECVAAHVEGSRFKLVAVTTEAPDAVQLLINYSPWMQKEIHMSNVSCGPQSLNEREPVKANKVVTFVGLVARKMATFNELTNARTVHTFIWQRETGFVICSEEAAHIPIGRWVLFNVTFDKRKSRFHTRNVKECSRPSGTFLDFVEPPYKAKNIEEVKLKCQCVLKPDNSNNFYTFFENKFLGKISADRDVLDDAIEKLGYNFDDLSDKILTVVVQLPVSKQENAFTLEDVLSIEKLQ